ncbi:MAG: B12-binding domain-containing radical SAM protein [Deltaproteobacteria bacterium]|nr:B12-binding domain-containing radical SAM protein [Deltaproteobacteria bacterium]
MKIVLIEPRSPDLHIFSRFGLPRLGAPLLATIARDLGHDAAVFAEEVAEVDWDEVRSADLVGISTITSTAPRAYAVADRARFFGRRVVIGGPHATYMPAEAAAHADWVLMGEAEHTFVELIEHIEGRRPAGEVHGMACLDGDGLVRTAPDPERVDVDANPAPDFSLVRGWSDVKGVLGNRIVPVQTSRGCPFDCCFCSVTGMFGRRIRYRSTASVMEELLPHADKEKNLHVFFYDDNFAASPARAKEILRAMKAAKTRFGWSTQVRADAARDDELLTLLRETNCDTVYIGVESVNPASLASANKRQEVEATLDNLLKFRESGIDVHGMFVLGFDDDGPDIADATVAFARRAKLMSIQALVLTPLPGSRTFDEMDRAGRILFRDWSMYDTHHVVIRHPRLSAEQLQEAQIRAHRKFYSPGWILKQALLGHHSSAAIACYARALNRRWKRDNSLYLRALKLLKPSRELEINMSLRKPCGIE